MKRDVNREKRRGRIRRHERVRDKVRGTAERPRLCVFRSLNHIYAQIIDDSAGRTLVYASSLKVELAPAEAQAAPAEAAEKADKPEKAEKPEKGDKPEKAEKGDKGKGSKKGPQRPLSLKMRRSIAVGKAIAVVALEKGIKIVAFDRGGYLYHGRVAALAKAAREGGLEF